MKNTSPLESLISLKDKTAIVTGGAMGIGLGIAYRLAEAGANVIIADINKDAGESAADSLQKEGFRTSFIKADVSNDEDVKAAVDFAIEKHGKIDILVNNAGIYPNISLAEMNAKDFDKIISVNLKSVLFFTKRVSNQMINQGEGGKIINITSIDALHPSAVGLSAYDSSKHGLWGFTKSLALELAPHKIYVNAIAPGIISTPGTVGGEEPKPELEEMIKKFKEKIPMQRMGEADDIGRVALFLASDLSSYMTGSQIVADGGVLLA